MNEMTNEFDRQRSKPTLYELESSCRTHMVAHGLPFDRIIQADGQIHRFSADAQKQKRDEWYVGQSWIFRGTTYLALSYSSWSNPDAKFRYESWKESDEVIFSREENEAIASYLKNIEKQAEKECKTRHEEAAIEAQKIWNDALKEPTASEHKAYLQLKGIKPYSAKFGKNSSGYESVILSLRNIDGKIRSLQFISVDQSSGTIYKSFLTGGEKKGCFFVIGNLSNADSFFVTEGFATGSSVHQFDGRPVVVAFDCGNIEPVVATLRAKYPHHQIIIAGDDDVENQDNPGRNKALAAATKYRCSAIFPIFPADFRLPASKTGETKRPTDWNDLLVHFGIDETKRQLIENEKKIIPLLIQPGKTHLVAQKGLELLSNSIFGIFQRLGQTVRIVRYIKSLKDENSPIQRDNGALMVIGADETWIVKILSEQFLWTKLDKRSNKPEPVDFPEKAARFILSNRGANLPVLTGFIGAPTLQKNGTILDVPSYDPVSGLFFDPCGTSFPPICHHPTQPDAETALCQLKDLLKDFRFDGDVSFSVAIAELMTGVIRRSIDYAPVFGNNAPEAGSGKSLLGDVASIIATGNCCTCISPAKTEEEMRKRLASVLIGGDPIICIDNLSEAFESDSMCSIITSQYWQERMLGTNTNVQIPTNALFIFTGNNLTFKGDMCSRVAMCNIDPGVESPGERIFDRDLRKYTAEHRGELVAAILTIIRAYIVAGCPDQKILPFRLFSEWSRWIRSPLVWLGMKDPYESTKHVTDIDPVRNELATLFAAWSKLPSLSFSVKQLLNIVTNPTRRDEDDNIQDLYEILLDFSSDGKGGISPSKLGNKLRQVKGRIVNGYCLEAAGKDSRGAATWKIVRK
jgi:phage/plasmid primase-like uncharacterized protein